MSGNVKVVARFRPPNSLELREGGDIVVAFDESVHHHAQPSTDGSSGPRPEETVKIPTAVNSGSDALNGFTFDRVFPMDTRQSDVFQFGIKETVDGESLVMTVASGAMG